MKNKLFPLEFAIGTVFHHSNSNLDYKTLPKIRLKCTLLLLVLVTVKMLDFVRSLRKILFLQPYVKVYKSSKQEIFRTCIEVGTSSHT